jgi:hypothetical protein
MLLTLLSKGVGYVHLDFVANWVTAERQRKAEETTWRAAAAALVLAASLAAVLTPAAVSVAALLGWLG